MQYGINKRLVKTEQAVFMVRQQHTVVWDGLWTRQRLLNEVLKFMGNDNDIIY